MRAQELKPVKPAWEGLSFHTLLLTHCLPGGSLAYLGTMPISCNGGGCFLTALLMLQFPQDFSGLEHRMTQRNRKLTMTKNCIHSDLKEKKNTLRDSQNLHSQVKNQELKERRGERCLLSHEKAVNKGIMKHNRAAPDWDSHPPSVPCYVTGKTWPEQCKLVLGRWKEQFSECGWWISKDPPKPTWSLLLLLSGM